MSDPRASARSVSGRIGEAQVDDVFEQPSHELVVYWQQVARTVLRGEWAANWPDVSVQAVLRKCSRSRSFPRPTYPSDVEHDLGAMANLVFAVDFAREVQQLAASRLEGVELVEAAIAGQAEALLQLQARGAPFGAAAVEAIRPIDRRRAGDHWRVEALEKRVRSEVRERGSSDS